MQTVTVSANQAGQRLDKFLHKCLPEAGNGFLYKMLRRKNITLNGKKAEGREILSVGDKIVFFLSEETYAKFSGMAERTVPAHNGEAVTEYQKAYRSLRSVGILYEDENVLLLNKPAGILTQKAKQEDLSLNEWLIGYLLAEGALTETELLTFRPSVCNRLDRNTSGIVLCGKSLAGLQAISRIIKERTIRKYYRTICRGEVKQDVILEGYLHKDERSNRVTVRKEKPADPSGQDYSHIRTAFHPLRWKNGFTLLEVELITGKTHQIRSHLSSTGHPLIGDRKYGDQKINRQFEKTDGLKSQLLHAYRMVFPREEGVLAALSGREITAPLPGIFQTIEDKLF